MGFLKKIFKGVKKVFKKIGKGIKKVAGKIGKFMGKIGIVGQIALSFLLPGIGAMLGKAAGAMMGSLNPIISGAGKFLNAAVKIGSKAGSLVKSVGEGVTKVIGKTIGATITGFLKDVTGGKLDFVGDTFLGKDGSLLGDGGVLGTAKDSVLNIKSVGQDLFSKSTVDSSLNKFAVEANIKNQLADSRFRDVVDPDLKVSSAEFQSNLEKGLSPMEAIQPQAVDLSKTPTLDISDPAKFYNTTNTEVGIIPGEYTAQIPAGLEPVTTGGSATYAFDDKGNALIDLDMFIKHYDTKVISNLGMIVIDKPVSEKKTNDFKDAPPCLITLASQGFAQGSRNMAMFQLGIYLRQRFPEKLEEKLDYYNIKYFKPPLVSREVLTIFKQVSEEKYFYRCEEPMFKTVCEKIRCQTRKSCLRSNTQRQSYYSYSRSISKSH